MKFFENAVNKILLIVIRKYFVKLHVFLRKTLDFLLWKCYIINMLIIPVKLSEFLRLEAEETLENLIKLSAEGARYFLPNLSGKRTEQIKIIMI